MDAKIDIGQYLKFQKKSADLYTKIIEAAALRVGLTKPEADILLFFANNKEYTTAADAVRMRGLSKGHVSKAVEKLSGKNLITVRTGGEDRRFQHIELDPSAGERIAALQAAQQEYVRILLRDFTAEETAALMKLLYKISENCKIIVKYK